MCLVGHVREQFVMIEKADTVLGGGTVEVQHRLGDRECMGSEVVASMIFGSPVEARIDVVAAGGQEFGAFVGEAVGMGLGER